MIKHWGLTLRLVHLGELTTQYKDELIKHFCDVNECSRADFEEHYLEMGNLWQKRSKHLYKIEWGKWKPELLIKEYGRLNK